MNLEYLFDIDFGQKLIGKYLTDFDIIKIKKVSKSFYNFAIIWQEYRDDEMYQNIERHIRYQNIERHIREKKVISIVENDEMSRKFYEQFSNISENINYLDEKFLEMKYKELKDYQEKGATTKYIGEDGCYGRHSDGNENLCTMINEYLFHYRIENFSNRDIVLKISKLIMNMDDRWINMYVYSYKNNLPSILLSAIFQSNIIGRHVKKPLSFYYINFCLLLFKEIIIFSSRKNGKINKIKLYYNMYQEETNKIKLYQKIACRYIVKLIFQFHNNFIVNGFLFILLTRIEVRDIVIKNQHLLSKMLQPNIDRLKMESIFILNSFLISGKTRNNLLYFLKHNHEIRKYFIDNGYFEDMCMKKERRFIEVIINKEKELLKDKKDSLLEIMKRVRGKKENIVKLLETI